MREANSILPECRSRRNRTRPCVTLHARCHANCDRTADPRQLGRSGRAVRPTGSVDRARLLLHVLSAFGQAREARRRHVFGVEQARAQGARRSRRRAGPHRLRRRPADRLGLARAARRLREARALAGDEAGRREAGVVDHLLLRRRQGAPSRRCGGAARGRDRMGEEAARDACSKPIRSTSRSAASTTSCGSERRRCSTAPASSKSRAAGRCGRSCASGCAVAERTRAIRPADDPRVTSGIRRCRRC